MTRTDLGKNSPCVTALETYTPIPESPSPLLTQLTGERIPYAHCAWCTENFKRSLLEEHYYTIHHVVLQPSCCSPPLQLRKTNFETFSTRPVSLRSDMEYEEAKDIIGAHAVLCARR